MMIRETESLNKIEINNCVGWGVLTTNVGIICGPVSSGVVTGNVENSAKKCLFTKKGLCQEHQVPGKKLNIPSEVETGKKFRICRNYPDISYPKPIFESFFAKTKFRLPPTLKKRNC